MTDTLHPNDSMLPGGSITSQDGRFNLTLQTDGNLVLYRAFGLAYWATNTFGQSVTQAAMQADGNFVLYGPSGAIWASNTEGHPGAWLVAQNDGNLVLYGPGGQALWSTGTRDRTVGPRGFLPSTSGFRFRNGFATNITPPSIPLFSRNPILDTYGVCGGMAFAARDHFETRLLLSPDSTPPESGPLYEFILQRLVDSFNGPPGQPNGKRL